MPTSMPRVMYAHVLSIYTAHLHIVLYKNIAIVVADLSTAGSASGHFKK